MPEEQVAARGVKLVKGTGRCFLVSEGGEMTSVTIQYQNRLKRPRLAAALSRDDQLHEVCFKSWIQVESYKQCEAAWLFIQPTWMARGDVVAEFEGTEGKLSGVILKLQT